MLIVLAALALQAPAAPPPQDPFAAEAPSPGAEQAVRVASNAFLAARNEGRYDEAWAMLAPEQQARRPRDAWTEAARDYNAQAGAAGGRRFGPVAWLENPAGRSGIFGWVAYSGDYENVVFACGILIWQLQPDGGWRLFREQHHAATRADAPNATPEQIADIRRQSDCPD